MSNIQNNVLRYEAAADLVTGDIVKLDTNGKAAKVAAAEATDAIGIVVESTDSGKSAPIITSGIIDVRVLVEDTDSGAGYDAAIARGAHLLISGKASGTYPVGQALSASTGTGVTTADATTLVAKALEAVAGSTAADTYTTIKAKVQF